MQDNDVIPREFLEQYLKLLSPDSFCTLLRFFFFYFDNKEKGNDISIPSSVFKKHILISDDKDRSEQAWSELSYWNLVRRAYKQNAYELNVGMILSSDVKFRVTLTDNEIKIRRKRNISDYLDKYIERIVASFNNQRLAEKVAELINGHVKYLYGEKGKVDLHDIKVLTDPFFDVPQIVLEKTCDVYITNHYAKKPAHYIHAILKNIHEQRSSGEKEDVKTLTLKQYKQEFEESNRQLAIKIVTGQIEDNRAYQAYIKTKDFKGLNKLYGLGCKMLIEQKREQEIKKDYDWIQ